LEDQRTLDQPTDLRKAIDDLQQAVQTVAHAKAATGKDALDLQEYAGLNHMHTARARGALASRLEKEAKLAQAAGSQSAQIEKQQDANTAFTASDKRPANSYQCASSEATRPPWRRSGRPSLPWTRPTGRP
jgi:hypothetical protein